MRNEDHDPLDLAMERLVDGELSIEERRRLLLSLDEQPEGWRRCALAFLESQAWTDELSQWAGEAGKSLQRHVADELATTPASLSGGDVLAPPTQASPTREITASRPAATTATNSGRTLYILATAASLLAAFTLGIVAQGVVVPRAADRPAGVDQIADQVPERGGVPFAFPLDGGPAGDDRPRSPNAGQRAGDVVTLWAADDEGLARSLRVPLVDAGTIDRRLGLEFQSALPEAVRSRLQSDGYEIYSTRRYAPLWLENGRSLVVPVEDTRIVPVGHHL